MKSLQEVLEGIEAFKENMEELGVDVQIVVKLKLEDLEAEG